MTLQAKENANQPNMQTEYYYKTQFSFEKLDQAYLSELETIRPKADEMLRNCPPNLFIPKSHPEALDCYKKVDTPGNPVKLMSNRG